MWFSNLKKYKRLMFIHDQCHLYKKVSWEEIREEYKNLLFSINWKRTPQILLPSGCMFIFTITELYESTERLYQSRKRNKETLKLIRRKLDGNSKH